MQSAPVSWRAETKRPPAATIAFVTARLPLPISPKTTSPPRPWKVWPIAWETNTPRNGTLAPSMRRSAPVLLLAALLLVVAMGPWAVPLLIVAVAAADGPVRRRGSHPRRPPRARPPRPRREGPLGAPSFGGAGFAAGARPALPAWSAGTRRLTSATSRPISEHLGAHQCRVRASPFSRASPGSPSPLRPPRPTSR